MGGEEEFFAWQGKQEDKRRQGRRHQAEPPTVYAPPLARGPDDVIDVQEHHASTTIVERIRAGLLKHLRGE